MSSPRPIEPRNSVNSGSGRTVTPVVTRRARPVFQGPTYKAPQYHSKIWGRLIFFLFIMLLVVAIVGGGGVYWLLHRSQSSDSSGDGCPR